MARERIKPGFYYFVVSDVSASKGVDYLGKPIDRAMIEYKLYYQENGQIKSKVLKQNYNVSTYQDNWFAIAYKQLTGYMYQGFFNIHTVLPLIGIQGICTVEYQSMYKNWVPRIVDICPNQNNREEAI